MLRKFVLLAVSILGMFMLTSPAPLQALYLGPAGFTRVSLPSGAIPIQPSMQADFNRDGVPESLALANDRLTIFSSSGSALQSPPGWTVVQAEVTDLNQDDTPEATLLVWRPFRPWPVDQWLPHGGRIANFQDGEGYSCHIILIGWRGSQYGELWAGSALAEPVRSFAAADLNRDGAQELATLEGTYTDSRLSLWASEGSAPARTLKVWEWNGFGFTIVSDIKGVFLKLVLSQADTGHILILVP
jgi:hypothetical protein